MNLIIKNGAIYNGSENKPLLKDIFIKNKKINGIGDYKNKEVEKVIDAKNKIIVPGFIDINSNIDHHLKILTDTNLKSFLEQGITTAIGGNLGSSLAPLSGLSIETIEKWSTDDFKKVNIDWQSFKEYLETIEKKGIAINFGSFVGHSLIKRIITRNQSRDLTEKEIELSKEMLLESLKEGALGLSSSFIYGFSSNTPQIEITEILKVIKENNKVYSTELQFPEKDPKKSLEDIKKITKGIKTQINNFQPLKKCEQYKELIENLDVYLKDTQINFDYNLDSFIKIPIYRLLPDWLERPTLFEMAKIINSGRYDNEIIEEIKKYTKKEIKIIDLPDEFSFMKNKKIKEISQNKDKNQAETIFEIMKDTNLKTICAYYDVDSNLLKKLFKSKKSIISTNGNHFEKNNCNTFIDYLSQNKNNFSEALTKITSLPAKKLNIKNRGEIKRSYFADLVILSKNFELETVIINGKIVFENNKVINNKSGLVIK
jgi:N-acyl-D-aspartate/D-glutamate deacylase